MAGTNRAITTDTWTTVRFGDVVRHVTESETNPLENGIERYVGMEHIDPDSLHIRRWGKIADSDITFTRRFRPGQVLFGRRRAYQRKAAVAEFDGICSGDIMVFEPKNDALLPELLPFIVQSDGFFEYALQTSAGSLSPRTKWSHLAEYEFALPPKDEQRQIAEILWTAEEAFRHYEDAILCMRELKDHTLTHLTTKGIANSSQRKTELGLVPAHWNVLTVGDTLEICQYGLSSPASSSGQYPIFRMLNIKRGVVVENDMKYIDLSPEELETYRLAPGDILFNRTNSIDLVGKVGIYRLRGQHVFASYLIRLRVNQDIILSEYLNYYLNSNAGQKQILRCATAGVSQANINARNLRTVLVPVPPLNEQATIVSLLSHIDERNLELHRHLKTSRVLKGRILEKLPNFHFNSI